MKIHKHTMINISDIKPYENNARIHTTEQVAQIKASIKEFGFTNPLLIDSDYNLIAGHGRLEAIQQLNNFDYKDNPITQAPAIIVSDLSETQRKALIIADNKIADNSYFATDLLKQELQELESLIDLDLLGFSDSEISEILDSVTDDGGGGQVYSNKELDFSNDDFSKNITLCFDNLDDFRLVNGVLLKIDSDYTKAIIKICKELNND